MTRRKEFSADGILPHLQQQLAEERRKVEQLEREKQQLVHNHLGYPHKLIDLLLTQLEKADRKIEQLEGEKQQLSSEKLRTFFHFVLAQHKRNRKQVDPEGDEHFLRKFEQGDSYRWIAEHDPKALSRKMDRTDVINACRRARTARKKKSL
jgi:hypothetical protein